MKKTQRMTYKKKVILDLLRSFDTHPTAEWIYQQARQEIPGLSLGTVYRNLNLLRDNGEILELNYGSNQSHYDGRPENHYHFMCRECGRVFDVEMGLMKTIETKVKSQTDFKVEGHRLEFYGLCAECQAAENEKKTKEA